MSLLFSRLQENVTSTIFCNCNPDIDFIYSSVRRLFLFFIYFHQSAGVQKTVSGCLPKIFELCPLMTCDVPFKLHCQHTNSPNSSEKN